MSQLPTFYITVLNDKNVTEIGGETNVPIDMNAATCTYLSVRIQEA